MDRTAPAIFELGLVLLLAALAGRAARRIGLPAVVGYLAIGILVSPFTPGYVANREQLAILADVGVVLLLFEVGIEINPIHLARSRRLLLLAPLQVVVTWAIAGVVFWALGISLAGAAMVGLSVAMSSSVVVVNITRSLRRTTDPRTDEALLGWSVIQDLLGVSAALVLMVVIGLGGRTGPIAIAETLAFIALAVVAALLLPWLLTRLKAEHDLFLLVSVGSGLLLAGIGSRFFAIPLALAAFVAGLAITESPVADEARQRLLPFRDVFAVMFFVSLGTVIDPRALGGALSWVGLMLVLVIVAKVVPAWALTRFGRLPARPLQLAIGLGQVGEFSYVLGALALTAGLISSAVDSALIAAVVISIAVSSVMVRLVHRPA
ncbi:MAG: potassium transporter Kef [Chloroflexi bacterium]|nr:MAG: potassium transporter Kef [Chloroflexota bacterium]TME91650.1 MAG: potassium transporter Kef [Chloroflexota bacterium]